MDTAGLPNVRINAPYRTRGENFPMTALQGTEHHLTPGQLARARAFGATHWFRTKDTPDLPRYKREAIAAAGWEHVKIGHTSYKSKTWGARRI